MDINAARGRKFGISPEKIGALTRFRDSDLFSPAEKVALELAEALTRLPVEVPDDLFDRLRQHFDEAAIVQLAALIAMENFRSRFNRTFGIPSNELYSAQ